MIEILTLLLSFLIVTGELGRSAAEGSADKTTNEEPLMDDDDVHVEGAQYEPRRHPHAQKAQQHLRDLKMELWSRFGHIMLDETYLFDGYLGIDDRILDLDVQIEGFENMLRRAEVKQHTTYQQYISPSRIDEWLMHGRTTSSSSSPSLHMWKLLRGGGSSDGEISSSSITSSAEDMNMKIEQLSVKYGPDFVAAIRRNEQEHLLDCQKSCQYYYCEDLSSQSNPLASLTKNSIIEDLRHNNKTTIRSYSFGAVPPEDFASDFGYPLDLIHVTHDGAGLFSSEEAERVIQIAKTEGVDHNEYKSGKYKLGGNWLTELPRTRQWFNDRLRTTFFPLLAELFPQIVSSASVLRAHSVSLLKYNTTHPRTDVHVDDGVLAITVALTPKDNYKGGGTFMEHFVDVDVDPEDNEGHKHPQLIEMDVGHATLRPGSVRHGGHRVLEGERFVLGAFLLLEDRVEHVRRLKNRGAQLRSEGKLYEAIKHFEWGLALNPKCTTCLKDWAEILYVQRDYDGAEQKLRQALDLLEYKDSDALFTLGLVLSEQGGRDDDCIDMYRRSLALNGEDAELLYNLAIKIGDRHRRHTGGGAGSDGTSFTNDLKEELKLYVRCTKLDPNFGGAYLNLGTSLAEQGNLGDAETMFQKAASTPFQSDDDNSSREDSRGRDNREVIPKALVNLALIYHQRAGEALQHGQIPVAKSSTLEAIRYLDKARSMLEDLPSLESYRSQYRAIRLASHRNLGQIFASSGDMISCEKEFRRITSEFPTELKGWQMLGRVLEVQGKHAEMQEVISKIHQLS